MKRNWTRVLGALAAGATLAIGLPAATGGTAGASGKASTSATTLTIANEAGETWSCHFNPYNATDETFSFGYVYEELAFQDTLKPTTVAPWLATKWAWSDTDMTLTFTIRQGVTWSSGRPFTAADVVYSFDLLKVHPALDLNADWSVLSSVTQSGTDQVVFQFKRKAVTFFYEIASLTPIVPEYLWSKVADPTTYLDKTPIGTGPYVVSSCSGNNIQYKANPHYWQAGLPKITTVNYPAYLTNTPANEDLASGTDQWGAQYIPSVNKTYVSKDPKYLKYWFPPMSTVSVFINLKNPVLSDVAVRRAMSYAIDKPRVSQIGEGGEEKAANQTGIPLPTYKSWYDSKLAKQYGDAYAYDPGKAKRILDAAGYKMGPNGIMEKHGQQLSFSIIDNGDYSDWVASVNVIASELKAVGIQLTARNYSNTTYLAHLKDGTYELAYEALTGGPGPFYQFASLLNSVNTAPIGSPANSDYERYSNPATDALLAQYTATMNEATQHKIVDGLEKVMLTDVPTIPITEQPEWYEYDTKCIGGWVTSSDPYAQPAPYVVPDAAVVLLHLYPKKSCT